MRTTPDESRLSPAQRQIKRMLDQGKTPDQIAKRRKTSTNAVYQTVRRLKALGFKFPSAGNASGNGGASRRASAKRSRGRGRGRRTPTPNIRPSEQGNTATRIAEARGAVEAERATLAKERENAEAERDRLLAEAEARGKAIGEIDTGLARLDHVLGEFDAKVEVA